ncbi:MAG TPA: sodium:alanine symporter family protein, partial [Spongiibacteraceae bacterium]|nr:sodium:alanine symporter family protein [Spongiibacteraceae bacterium]
MGFEQWVGAVNGVVWGPGMLLLLLGTGIYLSLGLRFVTLRNIPLGFRLLLRSRRSEDEGDIPAFNALMTALSATVGTGNIVGVATAITLGGPGALFWMWCTALVGMATKYAEAVCAVRFRERDARGNYAGGPMYYIQNGLGPRWRWLAVAFAGFGTLAGFGIGNTVQANSIADAVETSLGLAPAWTAVIIAVLVGAVILGGITRIGKVAGVLVPFMALGYLLMGLTVIALDYQRLPMVFGLVLDGAFSGTAASGGFAGAAVAAAIRFGVARGIFSNEAGLGSAPIAHAAARCKDPLQQGVIAMLGTFIDTVVICSVTGFAILLTGAWTTDQQGAAMTAWAFQQVIPGGDLLLTAALCLFAFSTMLGWSYYGERCAVYLFGVRALLPFRLLWIAALPIGALAQLDMIWLVADTLNALMAIPNLIALLLLSPLVFRMTREGMGRLRMENAG